LSKRDVTSFIYHRDGGCCRYCGLRLRRSQATVDHYVPKYRGGDDDPSNLRLSCVMCNNLKGNLDPESWEGYIVEFKLREKVAAQQGCNRSVVKTELLQRCAPLWRERNLKGAT
jgi:hypothetical protein